MIDRVNRAANALTDVLLRPLWTASPWIGLLALALLAALIVLGIMRLTTDSATIRRRRDRVLARILEMALFRDDAVLTLGALKRAVVADGAYLAKLMLPVALSIAPMILLMVQVHERFSRRGLQRGEAAVVTVRLAPSVDVLRAPIRLSAFGGVAVDSDPVRVPQRGEVSWRLRATARRTGWLCVAVGSTCAVKTVVVSQIAVHKPAVRTAGGTWARLLHPSEPPLPADGPIRSITVAMPAQEFRVGGVTLHWLSAFLLSSLLFALLLMRPLRVTI